MLKESENQAWTRVSEAGRRPQSTPQNRADGDTPASTQTLDSTESDTGHHGGDFAQRGFIILVSTKSQFEWIQEKMEGKEGRNSPV